MITSVTDAQLNENKKGWNKKKIYLTNSNFTKLAVDKKKNLSHILNLQRGQVEAYCTVYIHNLY